MEEYGYRTNQLEPPTETWTIAKATFEIDGIGGRWANLDLKRRLKSLKIVDQCHESAVNAIGLDPYHIGPVKELKGCTLTCNTYNSDGDCTDCDIDCSDEATGG